MLITSPIPNFIGGISQQPPSIRNSNEAQDILNAVPSATDGLVKRPPTLFQGALSDSSNVMYSVNMGQFPFFHLIERDETERYILSILRDGTPLVYSLNGVRQTVNVASGASLGTVDAFQRRAMTIGDVTFIANTTQTVAMTASVASQIPTNYNQAGLVWIRQSNYNREHIVKLTSSATTSTFKHSSRSVQITGAGSSGTNGVYTGVVLTYVSGTAAQTYPTATITVSSNKVTKVQITSDGVGWESENIVNAKLSALSASIGNVNNFEVTINSTNAGEIGTDHVAKSLVDGTNSSYIGPVGGIAGTSPYTSTTVNDSVIYIQSSADFTAVVEDDFAGEGIAFIRDEVQRFEDLPPTAPHGYMVKITGTPESPFDDYYVKFEADDGVFSRGVWVETVKPGIKTELDPATMPLILIRQSDGTFLLKKADGVTPGSGVPVGADYSAYEWSNRLVGDDETNPVPTFVGEKIGDMVYHQNRFGFCAGENLVLSETSEFFNFFRTTVLDLLDSDPIDVASSSPRVGKITAALPFNKDLILFTPSSQMVLRGSEVLTPKTISIATVADFDNLSYRVRPVPTANSIFFAYKNGQYSGIRELVPNELLDGSYLANDLTNNVSKLIRGVPTSVATTTHDNMAAVVSDGELFCYRYFNTAQERLQSAWFRFTTPDSNSVLNSVFLWAAFVESDLYVAVARRRTASISTFWITIEVINMGAKPQESTITSTEWTRHLDCRIRDASGGVYNATTGLTTFDLPKTMSYSAGETVVVNETGYILPAVSGTAFNNSTQAVGTISVRGDWSGINAFIGLLYPMTFEMSPFHLKAPAGRSEAAMLNGRLQLKTLTLQYADTGYFRVETTIKNGETYVYPFTGEVPGLAVIGDPNILTGTMRIPMYSRNDNVTVKIQNDSPLPCKILSGEMEAEYTDRATRFR